jgi:hypothetical protein
VDHFIRTNAETRFSPPTIGTTSSAIPLSFVAGISDDAILHNNLMASPCVAGPDSLHQTILVRDGPNVGAKLNFGLERANSEWVVCLHQDVWLPPGWDVRMAQQIWKAEQRFGPIGVAGVYGVGDVIARHEPIQPLAAERIGWVVDRGRMLRDGPELPARVATLDELLLVVRRDCGLRFDADLGFHLYGADICLQARERGLAVVALGALCHHNSRHIGLGEGFHESAAVFARKWSHRLPVATPCVIIDRGGEVQILGNAMPGPRSIAYASPRRGAAVGVLSTEGTEKHGKGSNRTAGHIGLHLDRQGQRRWDFRLECEEIARAKMDLFEHPRHWTLGRSHRSTRGHRLGIRPSSRNTALNCGSS